MTIEIRNRAHARSAFSRPTKKPTAAFPRAFHHPKLFDHSARTVAKSIRDEKGRGRSYETLDVNEKEGEREGVFRVAL